MTDQPPLTPSEQANQLLQRGWLKLSTGDFFEAEDDLKAALAIDGQLADAEYALGLVYRKQDNLGAALQAFDRTLALINAGAFQEDPNRRAMVKRMIQSQLDLLQKT